MILPAAVAVETAVGAREARALKEEVSIPEICKNIVIVPNDIAPCQRRYMPQP